MLKGTTVKDLMNKRTAFCEEKENHIYTFFLESFNHIYTLKDVYVDVNFLYI